MNSLQQKISDLEKNVHEKTNEILEIKKDENKLLHDIQSINKEIQNLQEEKIHLLENSNNKKRKNTDNEPNLPKKRKQTTANITYILQNGQSVQLPEIYNKNWPSIFSNIIHDPRQETYKNVLLDILNRFITTNITFTHSTSDYISKKDILDKIKETIPFDFKKNDIKSALDIEIKKVFPQIITKLYHENIQGKTEYMCYIGIKYI